MLLKKELYTSDDYWNLPEGERAELINGQFYAMAPPSRIHQELVMELSATLRDYIKSHGGNCKVYPSPFAVNLDAEDNNWVEPDISIICDKSKLTDCGCSGAPDLIVEIVSPSSRKMDYVWKAGLYMDAGVREYWIVDPVKECTTKYYFEEDSAPVIVPFSAELKAEIYQKQLLHLHSGAFRIAPALQGLSP